MKPLANILKLKVQDNKCLEVALEGIENILHVVKDHSTTKAFHDVVDTLLGCDILVSLETLHREGDTSSMHYLLTHPINTPSISTLY